MYISSKWDGRIYLVTNTVPLAGDYNKDHVVDAADYTVWRDTLGEEGYLLAVDGNGDGLVNNLDYDLWVNHFGETWSLPVMSTSVPEPTGATLCCLGALLMAGRRSANRLSL